jgi:hypothetical protein
LSIGEVMSLHPRKDTTRNRVCKHALASLLVYAWLRPLLWDMPDLDAEDEVIGLAALLQKARAWQVSPSVQKLEHGTLC